METGRTFVMPLAESVYGRGVEIQGFPNAGSLTGAVMQGIKFDIKTVAEKQLPVKVRLLRALREHDASVVLDPRKPMESLPADIFAILEAPDAGCPARHAILTYDEEAFISGRLADAEDLAMLDDIPRLVPAVKQAEVRKHALPGANPVPEQLINSLVTGDALTFPMKEGYTFHGYVDAVWQIAGMEKPGVAVMRDLRNGRLLVELYSVTHRRYLAVLNYKGVLKNGWVVHEDDLGG